MIARHHARLAASLLMAVAAASPLTPLAPAQVPTAFTYQGQLTASGSPYAGSADIRVSIFGSAAGNDLIAGPQLFSGVTTDAQGRFTITPEFPSPPAAGAFLQIEVRTPTDPTNIAPFTPLLPRTPVLSAPFARLANSATNAVTLAGNPPSFFTNAGNLSAGTLPASRLPANVMLLDASQQITAPKSFGVGNLVLRASVGTSTTTLNAPNATIGRTITFPNASGTVITSANAADLTLAGDVIGNGAATTVRAIAGTSVSNVAPAVNQTLVYNGSQWAPSGPPVPTQNLLGDVGGTFFATEVRALRGFPVNGTTPANGDVLRWSSVSNQWEPSPASVSPVTGVAAPLTLSGGNVTIPSGAISGGLLASDNSGLARVTGNLMSISGGTISATASMQSSATISTSSSITAGTTVTADEFNYSTPLTGILSIPDAAFTGRDGVPVRKTTGSGGAFPTSPTTLGIAAPVNLPNGATITGVTAHVVDNNAAINLTIDLSYNTFSNGSFTDVATITTSGASAAFQALNSGSLSHVVNNSARGYSITVSPTASWTDSTAYVRAVVITYTLPRPAR